MRRKALMMLALYVVVARGYATFTGATGLEPATSGVTGRSWRFRFERGQAGKLRPESLARRCGRGGRFRREFAPGWVAKTAVLELLRECFCAPSAQAWAAWRRLRLGKALDEEQTPAGGAGAAGFDEPFVRSSLSWSEVSAQTSASLALGAAIAFRRRLQPDVPPPLRAGRPHA
jgi:hypothetical protein